MLGWHCGLNGREFEETLGDSEGQGSVACCSAQGPKELNMTQQLNNKKKQTGECNKLNAHWNK